jgi:hypothetical protein
MCLLYSSLDVQYNESFFVVAFAGNCPMLHSPPTRHLTQTELPPPMYRKERFGERKGDNVSANDFCYRGAW